MRWVCQEKFRICILCAAVAAGCAMSRKALDQERAASGDQAGLPRCGEPTPGVPRLDSYPDDHMPAIYWVEMIFNGSEWLPGSHIAMPYHHATRLDLTNVNAFPSLAAHQAELLRFTVEVTSREINPIAGRREWRATYHARIINVCIRERG
jgi:hypothetical protein